MLLAIIHQRGCLGFLLYALYRYAAYVMNYTTKQQGRLFIWDSNIDLPVEKKAGNFSVPSEILILH